MNDAKPAYEGLDDGKMCTSASTVVTCFVFPCFVFPCFAGLLKTAHVQDVRKRKGTKQWERWMRTGEMLPCKLSDTVAGKGGWYKRANLCFLLDRNENGCVFGLACVHNVDVVLHVCTMSMWSCMCAQCRCGVGE